MNNCEQSTRKDNRQKRNTKDSQLSFSNRSYDKTFSWENIQSSEPEHLVLVNVNRIYWKFSDMLQHMRYDECKLLEKIMLSIKDEKIRYVPMKVEDIKVCFSDDGPNLPKCTFIQY